MLGVGGWVGRNPNIIQILKSVGKNGRSLIDFCFNRYLGVFVQCFNTCNTTSGPGMFPDYPGYKRTPGDCGSNDVPGGKRSTTDNLRGPLAMMLAHVPLSCQRPIILRLQ